MKLSKALLVLVFGGVLSACTHGVVGLGEKAGGTEMMVEVSGEIRVGEKFASVLIEDFDGNQLNLEQVLEGKVGIVDFWAAWCPFCLEEMPILNKLQNEFGDKIVVVGVHRTLTEKLERGKEFADKQGIEYLLVMDDTDAFYRTATGSVFPGMPVAVYVGRSGVVAEIKVGPKTEEEMREMINKLLSEQNG